MGDRTAIEWSDATWNPVTGCTEVSPGCDHCYAKTFAERFRDTDGHYFERGFDVVLRPDKLDLPLRWKRPRRIFVNSMSDLFHDQVPDDYIAKVWAVMAAAEQHTFQVLTKRHGRMRSLLNDRDFLASMWQWCVELVGEQRALVLWGGSEEVPWPLPNVWLGVSTENQQWADIRIPALLATPATVRWISAEPLLGELNVDPWLAGDCDCLVPAFEGAGQHSGRCAVFRRRTGGLDWVVLGGESGRGARPMHPDWARNVRDQCAGVGVPFLFKQWGEWAPTGAWGAGRVRDGQVFVTPLRRRPVGVHEMTGEEITRVGKKAAGRELDGQLHDGYPAVSA